MSYMKNYLMDVMEGNVKHDYRLHGDNMNEVLSPDYQEFLDSQEPTIKQRDDSLEELISESKERDNA